MVKKLLTLMLTSVLACPLSTAVFAQEAPAEAKAEKESRWEGVVIRSDPDKSKGRSVQLLAFWLSIPPTQLQMTTPWREA